MNITQTTPPSVEPLATTDAPSAEFNIKTHLHIDGTDDDDNLNAMIEAARKQVEIFLRRSLITQTWLLQLDCFPREIILPNPPAIVVGSLKYIDTGGDQQLLDDSLYDVDYKAFKGSIIPAYQQRWPATRAFRNAVEVTYTAGYGTAATDVPMPIIQAMKLIIGNWHEHREDTIAGTTIVEIPNGAKRLLTGYRIID